MKLVITTQHCENYGDEGQDYWKMKGGSVYVVENLTAAQAARAKKNHPVLASLIQRSNSMFREYIVSVEAHNDAEQVCESWEQPILLSYKQGQWHAREVIENNEYGYMHQGIARAVRSWVMLPQGEIKDYLVVYTLQDGREAVGNRAVMQLLAA